MDNILAELFISNWKNCRWPVKFGCLTQLIVSSPVAKDNSHHPQKLTRTQLHSKITHHLWVLQYLTQKKDHDHSPQHAWLKAKRMWVSVQDFWLSLYYSQGKMCIFDLCARSSCQSTLIQSSKCKTEPHFFFIPLKVTFNGAHSVTTEHALRYIFYYYHLENKIRLGHGWMDNKEDVTLVVMLPLPLPCTHP